MLRVETRSQARRRQKIDEGCLFTIFVNDGGHCFVGLLVRKPPRGAVPVAIAYFYGPFSTTPLVSSLSEYVEQHKPVLILRVGIRLLKNGGWKIVGQLKEWNRDRWPLPSFMKKDLVSGTTYLVQVNDDAPAEDRAVTAVSGPHDPDSPIDILTGPEAAEALLSKLAKDKGGVAES